MKKHVLRRAGALVLALAMALSLAAPAWAVDGDTDGDSSGDSYSLTIGSDSSSLKPGDSATLTATLSGKPDDVNEADVTYTWSSNSSNVTISGTGNSVTVAIDSAASAGTCIITVAASWQDDSGDTVTVPSATCTLTITEKTTTDTTTPPTTEPTQTPTQPPETESPAPTAFPDPDVFQGLTFVQDSTHVWSASDANPWTFQVSTSPAGTSLPTDDPIEWEITNRNPSSNAELPTWKPVDSAGLTIRVTNNDPGEFVFTAKYGDYQAVSRNVTISGIELNAKEVNMYIGQNWVLAVKNVFGMAQTSLASDVVWTSSDPSVVTVINGELLAWQLGTAVITANKNGYTAECKVSVVEDDSVIAGPYKATAGDPLIFGTIYEDLNKIAIEKTKIEDLDGNLISVSELNYINNVKVSTDQGTLYINYNSEANTGAGVGMTDRFALYASGGIYNLSSLYFVPRQGFLGTAEITFTGWAKDGTSFAGTVKVEVDEMDYISYRTVAGEPVTFLSGDFNSFCRNMMGRDLNYVTFNLPQTSQGTLYYNYTAAGQYGDRVTTSTQYSRSGRYLIDDVTFVPNAAFIGDAVISFRGVDTAGSAFTGEVVISVYPASAELDTADVYLSGERGQPVALQSNLFNAAAQATIKDTLSYVMFKLPEYDEGTLYYNYRGANNYDSRVSSTTRYYYSGVPGINGISFVPSSNNTGRVAIPYTGYGASGTTFSGTLYITIGESERSTVRYFIPKNGVFNFDVNDFNTACLLQMGVSLDYVKFTLPSEISCGELYYDYGGNNYYNTGVYSNFAYYASPQESNQGRIGLISFHAGSSAGSVTIPYTGCTIANGTTGKAEQYSGTVVIQVGALTPEEVNLTCKGSGQAWLSAYTLSNVCSPVMNGNLSYIEITGVPDPAKGRLYSGYTGFNTGTEVKQGDRFYCLGGPGIDQLCFVPHSGFTGQVELAYIGFSTSSEGHEEELVSGRILVDVTASTASLYFNDMRGCEWAIDSVDYLYQNHAVEGVGGGRYSPRGTITKGDFTLMLVRAFGFTATGTVTYSDVPANSYYADAIRIASLLGIASGSNGRYYPSMALSRQDAIVMIRNALVADGRVITNGLAANLDGYYDKEQIASYALSAVGSLVQMGIVQGDGNGYLRPTALLNRAETAKLLHTLMTL